MQVLATILVAYFFLVSRVSAVLDLDAAGPKQAAFGLTSVVKQQVDRPASDIPTVSVKTDERLDTPLQWVTRTGRVAILPRGCRMAMAPYDLVIHFHGAPPAMETAMETSELNAALFVVNLGIGSGAYEDAFAGAGSLNGYLEAIAQLIGERCNTSNRSIARVALSGWSAGYGAIYRILDRRAEAERVDAVLLSDGMHAGFEEVAGQKTVNRAQMAPFSLFADEAVQGRKLFAITHSAIVPPDYASTTQTADYLLQERDIQRDKTGGVGPRPCMALTSTARAGNFSVAAYAGEDKEAHANHLLTLGDTLFPVLRDYWNRTNTNARVTSR